MVLAEEFGLEYSERIKDVDGEHFVLVDRRLSMMEPSDLLGVLYKDNGISKWHYPDWLYMLSKQREEEEGIEIKALLFLDEINLAPEIMQNASYSLVLDRKVHDLELADGVGVVAAGNVPEDRAFTFDLPDPLKTRFTHVTLKVPVFKDPERRKGWYYWAVENGIDSRILSFLSFQPNMLFHYVENDRTFPTPRGWEKASNLMKGKPNEKAWRAVAKACGYVAGLQFRQFLELSQTVDVDELLENPEKFAELDDPVKFSVIAALGYLFSQKPEKYASKLVKFAAHLFTGIYDDDRLLRFASLKNELRNADERRRKKIEEELKSLLGRREAEFSALILSNMASANRNLLRDALDKSEYLLVLSDLVFFIV